MNKNCFLLLFAIIFHSLQARTILHKKLSVTYSKDGTLHVSSHDRDNVVILQQGYGQRVIINGGHEVCMGGRCATKLGGFKKPAPSCKAILDSDRFALSGVYYIKTKPTISKVYCYMENIPGCGGGGWTTIMKTNGHKNTFTYTSALWQNKAPYHVAGGQSGVDHLETKLPTYWTMPFNSLCLGMKTTPQTQPKWIRINYKASSLYSVIADGRYRNFSIGRSAWKSLIPGSSLQRNCNKEGFNSRTKKYQLVRIGIISNQENECLSPDSRIGFGGAGSHCGTDSSVSTGNTARCSPDNGHKDIRTYGYILAQ